MFHIDLMTVSTDVKPVILDLDRIMLLKLVHQSDALGKRSQNGFKPEAWNSVVSELSEHGIVNDLKSVKERLRYVSTACLLYHSTYTLFSSKKILSLHAFQERGC